MSVGGRLGHNLLALHAHLEAAQSQEAGHVVAKARQTSFSAVMQAEQVAAARVMKTQESLRSLNVRRAPSKARRRSEAPETAEEIDEATRATGDAMAQGEYDAQKLMRTMSMMMLTNSFSRRDDKDDDEAEW